MRPCLFIFLLFIPFLGKAQGSWYHFVEAVSNDTSFNYQAIEGLSLFPDSNVLEPYDSAGFQKFRSVRRHNVGQVLDPKNKYFENSLNQYTSYQVDSISLRFKYINQVLGSTDTLEIRTYSNKNIGVGFMDTHDYVHPDVAWVYYDTSSFHGVSSDQVIQVLLNSSNSDTDYQQMRIFLPSITQIHANELFAVTYQFKPGFTWDDSDTLFYSINNQLTSKQLNRFIPKTYRHHQYIKERSHAENRNNGLSIYSIHRYRLGGFGWQYHFKAGNTWRDFVEQIDVGFHVMPLNLKSPNFTSLIETKAYPNPTHGSDIVNIDYSVMNAGDINIQIFDLQGRLVKNVLSTSVEPGNYQATTNIADLDNGMYVYTITNGATTTSGKFSVVH